LLYDVENHIWFQEQGDGTVKLGMALGLKPKKVGVHENISDSIAYLKEKGLA
jgi:hypothetical protein